MNKLFQKISNFFNNESASVDNPQFEESNIMEEAQKITLNSYDEVQYATKILLEHKKIIVIFSNIQKTERRRIIDFLSGVVFVNNGKITSMGLNQYLFTIK